LTGLTDALSFPETLANASVSGLRRLLFTTVPFSWPRPSSTRRQAARQPARAKGRSHVRWPLLCPGC
jgi:hypothetical protein